MKIVFRQNFTTGVSNFLDAFANGMDQIFRDGGRLATETHQADGVRHPSKNGQPYFVKVSINEKVARKISR